MSNTEQNPLMPEPAVRVQPRTRIHPAYAEAVKKIQDEIAENGFFGVEEFKELIEEKQLSADDLLVELQLNGVTFVKTAAVNPELRQEVLVDMRYMAAAMLLIYSDNDYALKHSVLKYVKKLFQASTWKAAFPMLILPGLLDDMYEQLAHNFTDQSLAEPSNLSNEDETVIVARAERYSHPMHALVKSDSELTAVYQLALRVMDIANGTTINGHKAHYGDVTFRRFDKPLAYNYFWRLSRKIVDRHSMGAYITKGAKKASKAAMKMNAATDERIKAERAEKQKNFGQRQGKINLTRKQRKAKKAKK